MNTVVATYPMNNNAVRNFTFEQFFDIFKTSQLDISQFWLINSGFDQEGNKKYAHLVIRACAIRPLFGPHLVSIFEINKDSVESKPVMRTLWVHSLTDLRRNMFQFRDRLSFERSTYLIPFEDGQLLIRLKSIRAFLKLPMLMENVITSSLNPQFVDNASSEDERTQKREKKSSIESTSAFQEGPDWASAEPEDIEVDAQMERRDIKRPCLHHVLLDERGSKMKLLLNHHVQIMVSYLNRELHQESHMSLGMVESYVTNYCKELLSQMNQNE